MKSYVFYKADRISETIEKQEFATNNLGDGLFRWNNGELKQELGNCQFYSNGTDMVRKINRIFADNGVYGRKYVRFYKTEKGAEKFAKS